MVKARVATINAAAMQVAAGRAALAAGHSKRAAALALKSAEAQHLAQNKAKVRAHT